MPANTWRLTNRATAGAAATATLAAPTSGTPAGISIRLLGLQASLTAGAAATTDTLQILDGATVVFQMDISAPANTATEAFDGLPTDIRAAPGNSLTVRFLNGGGGTAIENVNAQGDWVPQGLPFYGVGA